MASSSKTKSRTDSNKPPVDTLRERIGVLGNTLTGLIEAVNKASSEIKSLQPLLDTASKVWAEPSSAKPSSEPAPQPSPKTVAEKVPEAIPAPAVVSTKAFLEAINTLSIPELIDKLKKANAKQNVIRNIINERKKLHFHSFESLEDLIERIKGLAEASLEKIMSDWP